MLRNLLLTGVMLVSSLFSWAQCEDGRYRDIIFQDFELEQGVLYGNNINIEGTAQDLFMDIYSPAGDTETFRPLVIVAHGGSFVAGSRDAQDVVPLCQDLARMGYVAASIDYRLGIPFGFDVTTLMFNAAARGFQDSKAAVRFFRRNVAENGNTYGIDPDKIFFAGSSAGGFNAIHVAYLDQESELPPQPDYNAPGLAGGVEGESGNPGYSSAIAGAVNIAGAIWHPDIMENNDTPVCSFHGTGDSVVPFGTDMLEILGAIPVDTVHGSETIHQKADELGIENCFFVQFLEGHVPHVDDAMHYDTLRSITSNFLSHLVCTDVELDCEYREIDIVSSTQDVVQTTPMGIWPNPASNRLNVSGAERPLLFNVLDLTGQVVLRGTIRPEQPQLDITELKQGVYLLQVVEKGSVKTLRFHKVGG